MHYQQAVENDSLIFRSTNCFRRPKATILCTLKPKIRMTFSFKTISCTIVVYQQIQNDVRTNQIYKQIFQYNTVEWPLQSCNMH